MTELDDMTRAAFEAFCEFTAAEGVPPTVRELQDVLGLTSSSLAQNRLQKMALAGLIERRPQADHYTTRGWRLTDRGRELMAV